MGNTIYVLEAAERLREADRVLILTHVRPDGDTAGCAGALCAALRAAGKTAYILENPEITKRYAPLVEDYLAPTEFLPEFVVTVDVADYSLFPKNAQAYQDRVDLAIDHHKSNPLFAVDNLVAPEAGACGEVVCALIEAMGIALDREIANALYVAVSTDTGCFKYSNTTADTHLTAAKCLQAGVDGGEINRALFETKSRPRFAIEKYVFDHLEFYEGGKIAFILISKAQILQAGADMDDLDSIAALPRQIEGVQCGITVTENRNGTVKASVRTTKEIDASAICAVCGGGGHLRAAGATFDCSAEEAGKRILQAAREKVCGSKRHHCGG